LQASIIHLHAKYQQTKQITPSETRKRNVVVVAHCAETPLGDGSLRGMSAKTENGFCYNCGNHGWEGGDFERADGHRSRERGDSFRIEGVRNLDGGDDFAVGDICHVSGADGDVRSDPGGVEGPAVLTLFVGLAMIELVEPWIRELAEMSGVCRRRRFRCRK
jgi:hypothetical protein